MPITSYHLGCIQCKEHVWAGMSRFGDSVQLFRNENLALIGTFLKAHRDHPLLFSDLSSFSDSHQMELGEDGMLHRARYTLQHFSHL